MLATSAISVSLSSEGVSLSIGRLKEGIFWLPKLPPSKMVLNRARATLPPFSCQGDDECTGAAWQESEGLTACCLLLTAHCLLLTACCLLLAAYCLLLTACY